MYRACNHAKNVRVQYLDARGGSGALLLIEKDRRNRMDGSGR